MSSRPIETVSDQEFFDRLVAAGERVPLDGTLETTFRCNLNCVHCYVNLPVADAAARDAELTSERLISLLDEMAGAGTLSLLLTGGEVLCRPDFPAIYRHAIGLGMRVVVFTNGTLVTERVAELFAELPPRQVEISIYGATEATYESVTRVPGSFRRCMEGIERLRSRGVKLWLKTTLTRENVAELAQMQALAESLGLPFRYDGQLNARVDCGAPRHAQQVEPVQLVRLELADPRRRGLYERALAPRSTGPEEFVFGCGAGRRSYTVDPYGTLQLCEVARRDGYDLKRGSFAEGWGVHLPRLISRRWQTAAACRSCSLRFGCGNCAGAAELETGNPESMAPAFCRVTHLRAFGVFGQVEGHVADASCCLAGDRSSSAPGPERDAPTAAPDDAR